MQICAIVIDPRRLEIVPGGEFKSFMKPPTTFEAIDPKTKTVAKFDYIPHPKSLEFHAKVRGCTTEEVLLKWNSAPSQKAVWEGFMKFCERFHGDTKRKSASTFPVLVGWNNISYDNPIFDRMCERFGYTDKSGSQNVRRENNTIDLMTMWKTWTENNPDIEDARFDTARKYLGMKLEGGHDAIKDVHDGAALFIRLMKLQRYCASKTTFENSFAEKSNV